jgi:uncharacterized protein YraI/beta-lactamase class A
VANRFSFQHLIRFMALSLALTVALAAIFGQPGAARSQDLPTAAPVAFAEAIKQANLRAGPGIDYPQVGMIVAGTKYPLVGRNAHFPWYLIMLPDSMGWVYVDLVKVTGNIDAVPYSDAILSVTPTPGAPPDTATPAPTDAPPANSATLTPALVAATLAAPTASPASVMAEAIDTTNVRYGPGTDFPRTGTISKGQQYPVLRRHALFPWLEIAAPDLPGGRGWVFRQTVIVTGDLASVPITSLRDFGYPTLTPTAQMVVTAIPPWNVTVTPPTGQNVTLAKLSNDIYQYLLKQKFEPGTEQQGSVFLMDLRTGQTFSLNPGIAYSGMSLIKIPILVTLYRQLSGPPTPIQAGYIGEMMVCSDNLASNAVLRIIGDGDPYEGANQVDQTMQTLGLKDTFMVGPFRDDPKIKPQPVNTIKTTADQISTDPDPYNQSTPADLGWLLGAIYQCAVDGSGPLAATFPGDYAVTECRQIVRALSTDKIGVMIEAGVPSSVVVAHKHGWIDDTHGDAALVLTSGGDYVLTVMLHGKKWLSSDTTFPLISEISRMAYNTYNPDKPLDQIHPQLVPAHCTPDPELIKDLEAATLPPIR